MNHKLKRKWVAALRGGTWTQIKDAYRHEGTNKRCAMGVLAEVVQGTPFSVCDVDQRTQGQIQIMNDNQGKTFSQIADWIEKNL